MEQSDTQFKAFIRFLLDALLEVQADPDEAKRTLKMERILSHLQKVLED